MEMDVQVLAGGKQTRYEADSSKLMSYVDGIPAFQFTMNTLLEYFPEEFIHILSSPLFQDFNDFITRKYHRATLAFDPNPGSGSAHTLAQSFPWTTEIVFVTEANIFYHGDLIEANIVKMQQHPHPQAIVNITSKTDVANTHRSISISPTLNLEKKPTHEVVLYRNMGVYTLDRGVQRYIDTAADLIDVIATMHVNGETVCINVYNGVYLHIASVKDTESWREYYRSERE